MALFLAVNSALALRLPFGSKPSTPHLDAPKLPAVALAALITTLIVCLPSHVRRTPTHTPMAAPTPIPTNAPTSSTLPPSGGGDVALSIVFVETDNKRLARVDISPGERASPIAPVMTLRDGLTSPVEGRRGGAQLRLEAGIFPAS